MQSALARTHRAWGRLHDQGNVEAYTRKVMYHLQVSWWRRPRVAESLPGDMPEPRAGHKPDHGDATGTRLMLRRALLRLTARQHVFPGRCRLGQGPTRLSQDGTASISGKFTLDGRILFLDDLNRANGNGVVPRLTLFGPDGKVLSHATAPKFNLGYLVSVG